MLTGGGCIFPSPPEIHFSIDFMGLDSPFSLFLTPSLYAPLHSVEDNKTEHLKEKPQ